MQEERNVQKTVRNASIGTCSHRKIEQREKQTAHSYSFFNLQRRKICTVLYSDTVAILLGQKP
jgi:hypothetical protein